MKAVIEKIESSSFNQISDVFKSAGMAMMSSMGGASGPCLAHYLGMVVRHLMEKKLLIRRD